MKIRKQYELDERAVNRIIEMAWEDRTTFDAIKEQFGVPEEGCNQIDASGDETQKLEDVAS